MKKILLCVLSLSAMIVVSCKKVDVETSNDAIIEFKDPNFLKALLTVQEINIYDADCNVVSYIVDVDVNKDGKISEIEAKNVRGLELYDLGEKKSFGISEMPEIKYFTELTSLCCYGNELTALDVSNNKKLVKLDCERNNLPALDVSNNTKLKILYCPRNQITELDVTKNVELTKLWFRYNYLTSIDVSKNPKLTELICSGNQLTAVDVSKNPELLWLSCGANQLTYLDLSNNAKLQNFDCSSNPQLAKVVLPKNNSLDSYYIGAVTEEYGDIIEYK